MSRNTEYQFVNTDTETLVSELVAVYEQLTKITVHPASPEKIFIQWVANIILQERVLNNYTGNQNIPSRAEGENLDALGELFYGIERPAASFAVCTERFYISEAQTTSILVPAGTRVADSSGELVWETTEDAYIPIGTTYVDVPIRCQTAGAAGNGYELGQINTIVDVFNYYTKCENITVSADGADVATDDEYFDLLRAGMDGYSCAGARGAYVFYAKKASVNIADVLPNRPEPGHVDIYVLMNDGTLAPEEIKREVSSICNDDEIRPLTDYVQVKDAETVDYNIDFTYYIQSDTSVSGAETESAVNNAVQDYIAWQSGKFGRDINPDKLRENLIKSGVKRIVLSSPEFQVLRDGKDNSVPQVAKIGNISVTNGGYEDE